MKLVGSMNKEIAQELDVSEADISQTISRLTEKVKTVQDSVELLMKMDVIQEGPKYILTEKGRRLARLPKRKAPESIELHGVVWYDFETSRIHGASKIYGLVFFGPDIVGRGETIVVSGFSEAQIRTLAEKREKITSSTSAFSQRIRAPDSVVLTL